jgi:hypothetical protein
MAVLQPTGGACILPPRRRLAALYSARPPLSGLDYRVRLFSMVTGGRYWRSERPSHWNEAYECLLSRLRDDPPWYR